MRIPHQIVIAVLFIITAGNSVAANTSFGNRPQAPAIASLSVPRPSSPLLPGALGPDAARPAPGSAVQTAGTTTSEPPGPGSPAIPGGPGPLPDDDDDDDAVRARSANA